MYSYIYIIIHLQDEDILEGDRETGNMALQSLKERRAEFDELMKNANSLKYVYYIILY